MGSESCSPIRTDDLNGVSESCRPGTEMGSLLEAGAAERVSGGAGRVGCPQRITHFPHTFPPLCPVGLTRRAGVYPAGNKTFPVRLSWSGLCTPCSSLTRCLLGSSQGRREEGDGPLHPTSQRVSLGAVKCTGVCTYYPPLLMCLQARLQF